MSLYPDPDRPAVPDAPRTPAGRRKAPQKDAYTMSHRGDPATSAEAAGKVTRSGRAQAQRELVLRMVQESPGLTSDELAARYAADRFMVARRLPELAPEVHRCVVKVSSVGGSRCVTWRPGRASACGVCAGG